MISFFEVCNDTRKKLDRDLSRGEMRFLEWIHKRYEKEQGNFSDQDKVKNHIEG